MAYDKNKLVTLEGLKQLSIKIKSSNESSIDKLNNVVLISDDDKDNPDIISGANATTLNGYSSDHFATNLDVTALRSRVDDHDSSLQTLNTKIGDTNSSLDSLKTKVNNIDLSEFTKATTSASGKKGLVPAPSTENIGEFYLRSDGTWQLIDPDDIWDIGDIYMSTKSTSPAAKYGGEWERIASNRVLMGASSTHAAGTTVEAGLPNITGTGGWSEANNYKDFSSRTTGAFYLDGKTNQWGNGGSVDQDNSTLCFDASRSNPIYGASNTVQPAAYYVYIWHRVG